jgi:hypothetical protein
MRGLHAPHFSGFRLGKLGEGKPAASPSLFGAKVPELIRAVIIKLNTRVHLLNAIGILSC